MIIVREFENEAKELLVQVLSIPSVNHKDDEGVDFDWEWQIVLKHDASKSDPEEYDAYDNYFYGNKSYENTQKFNLAWLHHIHVNPHHWQHWVLINDDPKEGTICLDMPYNYIIEMICDWWSFSFKTGNLSEIFSWYESHKAHIKLSDNTRKIVEDILSKIKEKIEWIGQ